MSPQRSKIRLYGGGSAIFWLAVTIVVHVGAAILVLAPRQPVTLLIDVSRLHHDDWIALLVPLVTILVLACIHWARHGLRGESNSGGEPPSSHVDSAINRQSIYSAIGLGAIAVILNIDNLRDATYAREFALAGLSVAMLGIGTLFAMMSVLCYSQVSRWRQDDTANATVRSDMFRKARALEQWSWYPFIAGLAWAIAVFDAGLSVLAHSAYVACLFYYYFVGWAAKTPQTQATVVTKGDLEGLRLRFRELGVDAVEAKTIEDAIVKSAISSYQATPDASGAIPIPAEVTTAVAGMDAATQSSGVLTAISTFYGA